jgi:hypothetical protein
VLIKKLSFEEWLIFNGFSIIGEDNSKESFESLIGIIVFADASLYFGSHIISKATFFPDEFKSASQIDFIAS